MRVSAGGAAAAVACTLCLLAAPCVAEEPRREGFTLEVGLGGAATTVSPKGGESETRGGLAPLSLSLGGFLSPEVALMARLGGTSFFETFGSDTIQLTNAFYGVTLQYWPIDALFLGGGFGFAVFDDNPFFGGDRVQGETGVGLTARLGWSFVTSRHHSAAFVYELYPSFYEGATVIGNAFILQYQML